MYMLYLYLYMSSLYISLTSVLGDFSRDQSNLTPSCLSINLCTEKVKLHVNGND